VTLKDVEDRALWSITLDPAPNLTEKWTMLLKSHQSLFGI